MKFGSWDAYRARIDPNTPQRDGLAQLFNRGKYRFVPLVPEYLNLTCSLDVLFLRPDPPGRLIQTADIDARLKTLFDALKVPNDTDQLGKYKDQEPQLDEDPFYCLLEDDQLITHISVKTGILFEPTPDAVSQNEIKNDARLVIDVHIAPYQLLMGNIAFGGG